MEGLSIWDREIDLSKRMATAATRRRSPETENLLHTRRSCLRLVKERRKRK